MDKKLTGRSDAQQILNAWIDEFVEGKFSNYKSRRGLERTSAALREHAESDDNENRARRTRNDAELVDRANALRNIQIPDTGWMSGDHMDLHVDPESLVWHISRSTGAEGLWNIEQRVSGLVQAQQSEVTESSTRGFDRERVERVARDFGERVPDRDAVRRGGLQAVADRLREWVSSQKIEGVEVHGPDPRRARDHIDIGQASFRDIAVLRRVRDYAVETYKLSSRYGDGDYSSHYMLRFEG